MFPDQRSPMECSFALGSSMQLAKASGGVPSNDSQRHSTCTLLEDTWAKADHLMISMVSQSANTADSSQRITKLSEIAHEEDKHDELHGASMASLNGRGQGQRSPKPNHLLCYYEQGYLSATTALK